VSNTAIIEQHINSLTTHTSM